LRTLKSLILLALLAFATIPARLFCEDMPRPGAGAPSIPVARPRPVMESTGLAFIGTVQDVEHIPLTGTNRIGTTRITFHIDTAIRGVRAGQTLVVNEWAALWSSGERYRVGERLCLLLYPPSKLGLTSPVHGPAGRLYVRGRERVIVPIEQRKLLPPTVLSGLDSQGGIPVENFARALRQERSTP
jgi:hypothetical protein